MYINVPDKANKEDAMHDLETALSLFRLIIPPYFDTLEEPFSYRSDREHIGNTIRAAEDYIISAKKILETELERATTDRKENPPHTTE